MTGGGMMVVRNFAVTNRTTTALEEEKGVDRAVTENVIGTIAGIEAVQKSGAGVRLVDVTTQLVGVTTQLVGVTTPLVGVTTPLVGVTTPLVGVTTPPVEVTTPPVEVTTPLIGMTTPLVGVTMPLNHVSVAENLSGIIQMTMRQLCKVNTLIRSKNGLEYLSAYLVKSNGIS